MRRMSTGWSAGRARTVFASCSNPSPSCAPPPRVRELGSGRPPHRPKLHRHASRRLGLRWWCEARVDTRGRFSDETWRALKAAGLTMVFCGAESGSNEVLAKMNKGTTTDQIAHAAAKCREHAIIPEFSFVFGD